MERQRNLKMICMPAALGAAAGAMAQTTAQSELSSLGIEDLMKIEVITANRSGQSVMSAPAAIFVLTGEDIRRSGATTIPDMLIGIPGVQVARIDGNKWMVSMRGFNGRFANKLQVLIDGRSIYSPLFSGVLWDDHLVSPEDIERIEVVRGPFGATWGANAVNGVINIITKKASQSQGWSIDVGKGSATTDVHRLTYGGRLDDATHFRVTGSFLRNDSFEGVEGPDEPDAWRTGHLRFRVDHERGRDAISVGGYLSESRFESILKVPTLDAPFVRFDPESGKNRMGALGVQWTRKESESLATTVRASYSDSRREDPELPYERQTLDLEVRQDRKLGNGRAASIGASYRHSKDRANNTEFVQLNPNRRADELFAAFGHFERPAGRNLTLHLDGMLEHNDYTGWEFQPAIGLVWAKSERESLWTVLSRSVRSPNRSEADSSLWLRTVSMENQPPTALRLVGNSSFRAEEVVSFELGWRSQPSSAASYDLATFVSFYDNLRSFELQEPVFMPSPVPHLQQAARFGNKLNAVTGGVELTARFNPVPDWRLTLGYSFFTEKFSFDDGANDVFGIHSTERQGATPRHSVGLRSSHDFRNGWSVDLTGSFHSATSRMGVSAGTRLDARIAWRPSDEFEWSIVGQNLLDSRRKEGTASLFERVAYVPRGIYAMATWRR